VKRFIIMPARGLPIALAVLFVFGLGGYGGVEYYTKTSEFCGGSCHSMTEQYVAWQNNRHHGARNDAGVEAGCVDCHFAPGEARSIKAKLEGARHLAAYLHDPTAPLPIRPKIPEAACVSCHEKEALAPKEIKYTEKIRFKHGPHFGDKALEGQTLTCDDCHIKVTEEKHFEVPQDICFLCHLKLAKPVLDMAGTEETAGEPAPIRRISFKQAEGVAFDQGPSKCALCHTIPTKSLQAQKQVGDPDDGQPITHQSLIERGVPCESCHFEVVKGHGEIETGNVVSNGCMRCHNRSDELLASSQDGRLMHSKHLGIRAADCFDCHSAIEHRNRTDHLDFVRQDCALCHQDQHKYQKMLLAGESIVDGLPRTPQLMAGVNTNCMACHIKIKEANGHRTRTGSGEACVGCHTDKHDLMLKEWRTDVEREIQAIREMRAEARQALDATATALPPESLAEAEALFREADQFLSVVEIGNGVHNKKYAILLLDEAFARFDDLTAMLDK